MKTSQRLLAYGCALLVVCLLVTSGLAGQSAHPVPNRVTQAPDGNVRETLAGNVHPLARSENLRGAAADSLPMPCILLSLKRSDAQQAALQSLMDAQQDKSSPRYHAWLTPDEFGEQFGPSDADLLAVTDWLSGQGFQNVRVAAGRTVIEFGGNAGQVRRAFGTQIQNYAVHGTDLPERRKFPGRFQYRERFCKHPRLHSAAKHHDYGYCWTIANGGRECYSSFNYAKFGHL